MNVTAVNKLIGIIAIAVRCIIIGVGAIPPLVKFVKANGSENEADMQKALQSIIITAVIFGISFAIEAWVIETMGTVGGTAATDTGTAASGAASGIAVLQILNVLSTLAMM